MNEFSHKRLAKARRALDACRREILAGNPDFAADHAYYAMFYAAEAILASRGLNFRNHGAVHAAFGQHFVKTGEFAVEHHRALIDSFEARQVATYGIDPALTSNQALKLAERTEQFISAAEKYLSTLE